MGKLLRKLHKFWEFGSARTILAALCAHSVSISIGICQGYSAILIPQLTTSDDFHITPDQASWIASLGAVTNPIGSILSGVLAEYLGRRRSIQLSSLPFLIGWLCIAFGTDLWWMYAGRLITGIAAGMSSACYTYVSEISTAENRGILQALGPICASFGILLTYVLGYLLDWLHLARISILFCILTAISIHFFPESPPYSLKIGKYDEAYTSYLWFRRSTAVALQEVDKHRQEANGVIVKAVAGSTFTQNYLTSATVKPFLILVTLFFLQELSGIYSILYYTVNFFEETGVDIDDYLSSIIVGAIRFGMAIAAAFLINRFGRRTLCVVSSSGMALSMLVLYVYFKYYEVHPVADRIFPTLPLYFVAVNVVFSMAGMLPVPWVLVGEMFPLRVRSIMAGVVICMAQCFIFITVKIYPDLVSLLNFSGTLLTFLVASVITVVFCKMCLPETKGKSLTDIEKYFQGSKSPSSAATTTEVPHYHNNNISEIIVGGTGCGGNTKNRGGLDSKLGFDNKGFDMIPESSPDKQGSRMFTVDSIQR